MSEGAINVDGVAAGDPIRAKWVMDGAESLPEAAAKLRGYADFLDALAVRGWTLAEPVEDDYGFLVGPDGSDGRENEDVNG